MHTSAAERSEGRFYSEGREEVRKEGMEGGIDGPRSIPDDDDDWTQCCVARAEWEREREGA